MGAVVRAKDSVKDLDTPYPERVPELETGEEAEETGDNGKTEADETVTGKVEAIVGAREENSGYHELTAQEGRETGCTV